MTQSSSKVDETDTEAYLNDNPVFRLCRARRHRWPDPETGLRATSGLWDYIPGAAPGEPNCRLTLECERGCGTVKHRSAVADLKRQTVTFIGKWSTYDPAYQLQGGVRIAPSEAEASILFAQLRPLAEAQKPRPRTPAKRAKAPQRRLRAVS